MPTDATTTLVEKLTQAITASPNRLMSETEITQNTHLTESEFMARAKTFIKDAESGIPAGDQATKLTLAILAKQHRRRIPVETAQKLMKPLLEPTPATPLPHAAKKRKVEVLKKTLAKKAPVKAARAVSKPAAAKKMPMKTHVAAPTKLGAVTKPSVKKTTAKKTK